MLTLTEKPGTGVARLQPPNAALSVVLVSEFQAGETRDWREERRMLEALARQDIGVDFDVILVESEAARGSQVPDDFARIMPAGVKVVYGPFDQSSPLKNFAVEHCNAALIAVLETDVTPDPGWLGRLYARALEAPDYDVFTARTNYGLDTMWRRVCSVLDRTFDDYGKSGPSHHISNHAALYRAAVLKRHPYPAAPSPFVAARLRNAGIARDGHKVFFEHAAVTQHDIGGFDFIFDFRRNNGYAEIACSRKPGWMLIPRRLAARMYGEAGDILRVGWKYLRPLDWPLLAFMYFWVRIPETVGMIDALRGEARVPGSAHR